MLPKEYIVLDIETTGLYLDNDEITEIAAIKVINGEIVDEFSKLVNIEGKIPPFIERKTHITNEMLKCEKPIDVVLESFLEFIADYPLVGHNIKSFDYRFLNHYANKKLNRTIENEIIDTLYLARRRLDLPHNTLGNLCDYYEIEYSAENNHRALADVVCTQEVFKRLILEKENDNPFRRRYYSIPRTKENKRLISKKSNSKLLEGFNIAITGESEYTRESIEELITLNGGIVNNSVINATSFLLVCSNSSTTSKYRKAQELGKRIVSFEEFLILLKELEII
ncbi:exonuclease domain-containing protein [Mycoplasma sp. HF14]